MGWPVFERLAILFFTYKTNNMATKRKASKPFNPLKFLTDLKKANEKFEKLPIMKQRMAILQDALSLTFTRGYRITHGIYGEFGNFSTEFGGQLNLLAASDLGVDCSVCAKGALFCSRIRLGDSSPSVLAEGESISEHHTMDALEGIFASIELDEIENIFENGHLGNAEHLPTPLKDLYRKYEFNDYEGTFGERFYPDGRREDPHGNGVVRFRAIIENIIAEKGDVWKGLMRPLVAYDKEQQKKAKKKKPSKANG